MNSRNEQERNETLMADVAGMIIFGVLGIITFVAGCCGKYHQFAIFALCVAMFIGAYLEYKNTKLK